MVRTRSIVAVEPSVSTTIDRIGSRWRSATDIGAAVQTGAVASVGPTKFGQTWATAAPSAHRPKDGSRARSAQETTPGRISGRCRESAGFRRTTSTLRRPGVAPRFAVTVSGTDIGGRHPLLPAPAPPPDAGAAPAATPALTA